MIKDNSLVDNYDYCFVGSGAILGALLKAPDLEDSKILVISNQFTQNRTLAFNNRVTVISRAYFLNTRITYEIENLIILTKSHRWEDTSEFLKVMHALREQVSKTVVHISSGSVYGNMSRRGNEATPTLPISKYGKSKIAEEEIVLDQFKFSQNVIVLRVSNVYGNLIFNDFVNNCIRAIDKKETVVIFLNGTLVRDFLFLDCLISAIIKLLESEFLERETCFNVSSGHSTSIAELVAKIELLTGSTVKKIDGSFDSGVIEYSVLDNSKLLSTINWNPLSLESGLTRYFERDYRGMVNVK